MFQMALLLVKEINCAKLFKKSCINVDVMALTNLDRCMHAHIHRNEVVTTMSRSLQAGSTKMALPTNGYISVHIYEPDQDHCPILYWICHIYLSLCPALSQHYPACPGSFPCLSRICPTLCPNLILLCPMSVPTIFHPVPVLSCLSHNYLSGVCRNLIPPCPNPISACPKPVSSWHPVPDLSFIAQMIIFFRVTE